MDPEPFERTTVTLRPPRCRWEGCTARSIGTWPIRFQTLRLDLPLCHEHAQAARGPLPPVSIGPDFRDEPPAEDA